MKSYIIKICMLTLVVLAVACKHRQGAKEPENTPTSGKATIGVDETFQPIVKNILPVFHAMYPNAQVIARYIPEVDALNLLFKDSLEMVVISRTLTQKEKDYFQSRKFFPKEVQIAVDGIAVLLNPVNRDSLLTVGQIRQILMGEITSWKQINKSSALNKIEVIFDNPNSSTVRFVVDSITKTGKMAGNLSAMQYNKDVVEYVSKNDNAIGLIGVSWVSNPDDPKCLSFLNKIKVASVSREKTATEDNSYKPFQAYLALGKYPLTRNIYAINTEPRAGLVTGFTSFMAGDKGQRIILTTGILPATQPVRLVKIRDKM